MTVPEPALPNHAECWNVSDWEFQRGPLVEVLWVDSGGSSGWSKRDAELTNPHRMAAMLCASVGYLIEDVPLWITLALSCNANDQINEMITIPRLAIMQLTNLLRESPSLKPQQ